MTRKQRDAITLLRVSDPAKIPFAQLLVFEFGPETSFEGQLGGAIERFEIGNSVRILEGLFIHRDATTGELSVIDIRGDGAESWITQILAFRLDPAARRRATDRALGAGTDGVPADTVRELASSLAPGAAIAALLIGHTWVETLHDAIVRTDGVPLTSEFVEARTLAELTPKLIAATSGRDAAVESS
jgi:hypothetical protein